MSFLYFRRIIRLKKFLLLLIFLQYFNIQHNKGRLSARFHPKAEMLPSLFFVDLDHIITDFEVEFSIFPNKFHWHRLPSSLIIIIVVKVKVFSFSRFLSPTKINTEMSFTFIVIPLITNRIRCFQDYFYTVKYDFHVKRFPFNIVIPGKRFSFHSKLVSLNKVKLFFFSFDSRLGGTRNESRNVWLLF